MVLTDVTITVTDQTSSANRDIVVYRGDYNVRITFTLLESNYRYTSGPKENIIERKEAYYAQMLIRLGESEVVKYKTNIAPTEPEGKVTLTLVEGALDETIELGEYNYQIRLFSDEKEARFTLPPVYGRLFVKEPIIPDYAIDDGINGGDDPYVGSGTVGDSVVDPSPDDDIVLDVFDENDDYIKTDWEPGDVIRASKLDKIENAIYEINEKLQAGGGGNTGGSCDCDLTEYAKLSDIPERVSELENDVPYLTEEKLNEAIDNLPECITQEEVSNIVNETINNYNFINKIPEEYVTEAELLAKRYARLTDIPTKVSAFENDVPYATRNYVDLQILGINDTLKLDRFALKTEIPKDVSQLNNDVPYVSKNVTDAIQQNIELNYALKTTVPTRVGQLVNDKGYITSSVTNGMMEVIQNTFAKKADIPTNVSAFTNDAGYLTRVPSEFITEAELNSYRFTTKDYVDAAISNIDIGDINLNAYALKTEIPTKVSQLTNDVPYASKLYVDQAIDDLNMENYYTSNQVDGLLIGKIDIKPGYSLMSDSEIRRLASVTNYNDTNIKNSITSLQNTKADKTDLNNNYATKTYVLDEISKIEGVDLSDYALKKEIPTVTSQLRNDSGYITSAAIPVNVSHFVNDMYYITNSELLEALKGLDVSNLDLSAFALKTDIPTKVSKLTNDVPYATEDLLYEAIGNLTSLEAKILERLPVVGEPMTLYLVGNTTDGYVQYMYIDNKWAELGSVDIDLSDYYTKDEVNDTLEDYYTKDEVDEALEDIDLSEYALKTEIPNKTSQLTNDSGFLTSIPSTYVTEDELAAKNYVSKNELDDFEIDVDLTGYAKLTDIPTRVGQLTNDKGYITNADLLAKNYATKDDIDDLISDATLNNYYTKDEVNNMIEELEVDIDLSDYALKTQVPTKTSQLINDAGFLINIPTEYITESELFAKNYATKSEIPTKVSSFTNDKGYLTSIPAEYVTETELLNKSYATVSYVDNSIDNLDMEKYALRTEIPTIPTNVSAFFNDANYLTSVPDEYITEEELTAKDYATRDEIPTKVSVFENDAGYLSQLNLEAILLVLEGINNGTYSGVVGYDPITGNLSL